MLITRGTYRVPGVQHVRLGPLLRARVSGGHEIRI